MRDRLTGSVRNKLFGVVAVLALSLVIVAAVGVWSMRSLGATAEDLAHVDAESMEQIAGVEWRVQNIRGHVANHLYVFDGDLAAEDAEAAEVVKLKGEIGERLTTLDTLVPELDAENQARYATLVEKRQAYVAAYDQALKLSREETVAAAEDRSGSRTVYLEQVQPALDEFQDGHARVPRGRRRRGRCVRRRHRQQDHERHPADRGLRPRRPHRDRAPQRVARPLHHPPARRARRPAEHARQPLRDRPAQRARRHGEGRPDADRHARHAADRVDGEGRDRPGVAGLRRDPHQHRRDGLDLQRDPRDARRRASRRSAIRR